METEYNNPQSMEYADYPELDSQPRFASRLQLFAVLVYLISQGFTIPVLPIGPSWAVWPRLDDFAAVFLFLVYLKTRNSICPMSKKERFGFAVVAIAILLTIPSLFYGRLMNPDKPKGFTYGISQTYRIFEYFVVWFSIRGMTFSSKQFDKISYVSFFVVVFVVIIGIGNATGAIPPARLVQHLPYSGPWGKLKMITGATNPRGPYGWNSGYMVDQLVLWTAILLASKKPAAIFRMGLIAAMAGVIFLTGSRAATTAWCLSLAFWSHKSPKQLIIMLILIPLILTSFYVLTGSVEMEITERATGKLHSILNREEDVTMSGRTEIWSGTFEYLALHPHTILFGTGWGYSGVATPTGGHVHCMYLQAIVELGVFGALMFYALLLNMYLMVRGKDKILIAVRGATLAFLIAGMTGEILFPSVANGSFLGFVGAVFAIAGATHRGRVLEEQYYAEEEFFEEQHYSEEEFLGEENVDYGY